jgi:RHS repeat-associated protein
MFSLDADGNVVARFVYGAFGEIKDSEDIATHRRQFNGEEADAVSGLRYYGARYYDPFLLRWISADPLYHFAPEVGVATPQRLNLYAFSLNNPLRYRDPDGRQPKNLWEEVLFETRWRMLGGKGYASDFTGDPQEVCEDDAHCRAEQGTNPVSKFAWKYTIGGEILRNFHQVAVVEGEPIRAVLGVGLMITPTGKGPKAGRGKVPNPWGSRGSPAHQATILKRIDELKAAGHQHIAGGNLPEELVRTPGGFKSSRRPDITTRAPDGTIYRENVGRSTGAGDAIAREQRALDDIEAATGSRPWYTAYDRVKQ